MSIFKLCITPEEVYTSTNTKLRDKIDFSLIFYLVEVIGDAVQEYCQEAGLEYNEDSSYAFGSSGTPSSRNIVTWFNEDEAYQYSFTATGHLYGDVPPPFKPIIKDILSEYRSNIGYIIGLANQISMYEIFKEQIPDPLGIFKNNAASKS